MDKALESLTKHELIALLQSEKEVVSKHQKTIREIELEQAGKDRIIAQNRVEIASYQKENSLKEELIVQKINEALANRKEIRQKRNEIEQRGKEIDQKDKEIEQKGKEIAQNHNEILYLKQQVEQLKRMLFGQKRERFEGDPNQQMLPFELEPAKKEEQEKQIEQKIEYSRKRPNHKGRAKLPEHLPVEEVEIYPEGDLSEMTCIGEEITEELEYEPAKFYIKRYIRYKYAHKNGEGIAIGELPERVIEKGIPSASLLSMLLTNKYMDHLPLYRQKQRFARDGIEIASSTIEGWIRQALEKLEPLYESLVMDTKSKGYLQADETTIKVQDKNKKGACHLGYYWVYHSPIDKTVLFDYQPTRAAKSAAHILDNFQGYLQTDGYAGYDQYARKEGITHLACWAHARREFEKALSNDKERAEFALFQIQKLYAIERYAKENNLNPEDIKELRLKESLPVINTLGKWISAEVKKTLPKSAIGKAMTYSINRWDALSAYLYDGTLLIDNNQIENSIRPVALGRKNYLFAGSHNAAQRAAMIYSFFASCKKQEVNPFEWLKHTLQNINTINHKNISNLYPQNYKKLLEAEKM